MPRADLTAEAFDRDVSLEQQNDKRRFSRRLPIVAVLAVFALFRTWFESGHSQSRFRIPCRGHGTPSRTLQVRYKMAPILLPDRAWRRTHGFS